MIVAALFAVPAVAPCCNDSCLFEAPIISQPMPASALEAEGKNVKVELAINGPEKKHSRDTLSGLEARLCLYGNALLRLAFGQGWLVRQRHRTDS